jgi:hypothetical protein
MGLKQTFTSIGGSPRSKAKMADVAGFVER